MGPVSVVQAVVVLLVPTLPPVLEPLPLGLVPLATVPPLPLEPPDVVVLPSPGMNVGMNTAASPSLDCPPAEPHPLDASQVGAATTAPVKKVKDTANLPTRTQLISAAPDPTNVGTTRREASPRREMCPMRAFDQEMRALPASAAVAVDNAAVAGAPAACVVARRTRS